MSDSATPEPTPIESMTSAQLRAKWSELATEREGLIAKRVDGSLTAADTARLVTVTDEANKISGLVAQVEVNVGDLAGLPTVAEPVAVVVEPVAPVTVEHITPDAVINTADLVGVSAAAQAAASIARVIESQPVAKPVNASTRSAAVTASASTGRFNHGQDLNLGDIGAIVASLAGDAGRQGTYASIGTIADPNLPAPVLQAGAGAAINTAALARFMGAGSAITAAPLDVCGPPEMLRNRPDCNDDTRYLRGLFREIPASRGAIEFYRSYGLADAMGAVDLWDQAKQAGVDPTDPNTWKPTNGCWQIPCLTTDKAGVEEILQCLCMDHLNSLVSPEAVAAAMSAIRAATARKADGQLLGWLDPTLSPYKFDGSTTPWGALPDVFDAISRIMGAFAAANRQLDLSGYTLIVEPGFIAQLAFDEMLRCNTPCCGDTATQMFSGLGIGNIVVTPDWAMTAGNQPLTGGPWAPFLPLPAPGGAPVDIPARPENFKVRLVPTGDYGYLSPGTSEFGIVPSLDNMRQNKVCWFGREYAGLAKLGCKPGAIIEFTNLAANGVRAACA